MQGKRKAYLQFAVIEHVLGHALWAADGLNSVQHLDHGVLEYADGVQALNMSKKEVGREEGGIGESFSQIARGLRDAVDSLKLCFSSHLGA